MNRRTFVGAVTLGMLCGPLAAEAQQIGKVYRIGFLSAGSPPTSESRQAFEHALGERDHDPHRDDVCERPYCRGTH